MREPLLSNLKVTSRSTSANSSGHLLALGERATNNPAFVTFLFRQGTLFSAVCPPADI
jgi:hypothetical protein